jgi:hypothetical protein
VLKKNPNMGSENLRQHINAISDLWRIQKSRGMVTGDNPRSGGAIKGMIRRHQDAKKADEEPFLLTIERARWQMDIVKMTFQESPTTSLHKTL